MLISAHVHHVCGQPIVCVNPIATYINAILRLHEFLYLCQPTVRVNPTATYIDAILSLY
jgi:hypothetical protein